MTVQPTEWPQRVAEAGVLLGLLAGFDVVARGEFAVEVEDCDRVRESL
jgi:hypothetical protein